jgi:ATP-binding cassette subfamily C protein/ATP-binding cassette subfamily C protein LapB
LDREIDYTPCLIPLLEALEWKGEQHHYLEALPHPKDGLDFGGVLNAMSNLHFHSEVAVLEIDNIQSFQFPCFFVNQQGDAYVLLNRVQDTFLVYDNNSTEYQEVENFHQVGRFAQFKPMLTTAGSLLGKQTNWFMKVLSRFKRALWASFGISFFMSLLAIASPVLIMFLYSHIQSSGKDLSIGMVSIGVIIYLAVDISFRFFRSHLFNYIGARLSYIVGGQVIRRILYLHPSKTSSPSVASQISRIKEFEGIHEFMSSMALPTLFDTFMIIILLLGLAVIGGELAYIPIAGIAIFFIFGAMVRSVEKKLVTQSALTSSNRNELLSEMVSEMRSFRTSGVCDKWMERFKERSVESALNIYASSKVSALVNAFSNFLIQGSGLVTVSFGVVKVLNNELSMGGLLGVMLITFRILTPLKGFFNTVGQFERFNRSIKQIDQFMNMELEVKDEEVYAGTHLNGEIRYVNIYLKYSSSHLPALQNLSLNIPRGQFVNFCGPGGSGRSSLFKVLMDLSSPQAGQVFVDGINVKQLSPIQMRMSFAILPRHVQIFEASLLDNILMAAPSTHKEDVLHWLKRFGLLESIERLPDGLDTAVHPDTHNFSDNFVRKLGLVRVFIKNSNIILMDKPELNLNDEDLEILEEVLEEKQGVCTIMTISNNPKVLSWAHRGILMDHGIIVKDSTPEAIADYFYKKA